MPSIIRKLLVVAVRIAIRYLNNLDSALKVKDGAGNFNNARARKLLTIENYSGFAEVSRNELLTKKIKSPLYWLVRETDSLQVAGNRLIKDETIFGQNIPPWVFDKGPYNSRTIYTARFDNCYLFPVWGAIMPSPGVFFEPSVRAARYKSPDLAQIPGVVPDKKGDPGIDIEALKPQLTKGKYILLNHWGGKNYGHFIFDSLPGVLLLYEQVIRGDLKIITGPLADWQKQFLSLLGISREKLTLIDEDCCTCESLVFPSFLSGNLNQPALFTRVVGDWLKRAVNDNENQFHPELVYICRKNYCSRQMSNEKDLLEKLVPMGFNVVCPEQYTVEQQIGMFSRARVIMGESGAGLSNIVFAPPSCKIIEIMPQIKETVWIKRVCGLLNMDWYCVYSEVREDQRRITVVDGIEYKNLSFVYDVNIDNVMHAVKNSMQEM